MTSTTPFVIFFFFVFVFLLLLKFLWELKTTAKQSLNEGQMMSCWLAVSRKRDSVNYEEFKEFVDVHLASPCCLT